MGGRHEQAPRRPHLFTLMLLAFGLVIVLGMGGMVSVFFAAVHHLGWA